MRKTVLMATLVAVLMALPLIALWRHRQHESAANRFNARQAANEPQSAAVQQPAPQSGKPAPAPLIGKAPAQTGKTPAVSPATAPAAPAYVPPDQRLRLPAQRAPSTAGEQQAGEQHAITATADMPTVPVDQVTSTPLPPPAPPGPNPALSRFATVNTARLAELGAAALVLIAAGFFLLFRQRK